jgi:hypothetical protein
LSLQVRIASCFAMAVAITLLAVVARFILEQPQGAYREMTYLSWWAFLVWTPLAAVGFVATWAIGRKRPRDVLVVSLLSLAVAFSVYFLVQWEQVQAWILPPIAYK